MSDDVKSLIRRDAAGNKLIIILFSIVLLEVLAIIALTIRGAPLEIIGASLLLFAAASALIAYRGLRLSPAVLEARTSDEVLHSIARMRFLDPAIKHAIAEAVAKKGSITNSELILLTQNSDDSKGARAILTYL